MSAPARTLSGKPLVSIVVACRNELSHIRAFLDSIIGQNMAGMAWEAIIADGLSDDGTFEILREYSDRHPELCVVRNNGRFVSHGLNAAIRASRGEIIIRMDAHTFYSPNYCLRSIELLASTGADNVGGPARTRVQGAKARAVAAAYHSRFSTGGARFHDDGFEGWVDTVPYGCWRRSTLLRLGLFDESLIRNQDDELNLRLIRAGGKIWQSPKIESWYAPRPNFAKLFRQYFQYGFWKVAVIRKHRLPGSWRQLVPVCFVGIQILLLGACPISLAAGRPSAAAVLAALWIALAACYLAANLVASAASARRFGFDLLPFLPVVFAVYHYSYGLGFLAGFRFLLGTRVPSPMPNSAFTNVTR
jgi:glycosyltransferase involved in cell wall biosynthesis